MRDLRERLRDAVPAKASFTAVDVNRHADRVVRRRRGLGITAMVLVIAVTVGVVQLAGDEGEVLLESPTEAPAEPSFPAALEVFDLPPLSAADREAASLPDQPLPAGTRLARDVDGFRYYVVPSITGGFCLAVATGATPVVHVEARCDGLPTATGLFVLAEGQSAWLVPDGYIQASLPDGRTADVVNNVAAIPAATTDPAPEVVTFTGPAGDLVIRNGEPPFPGVTPAFPSGLTAGMAAPDPQLSQAVARLIDHPAVNWLYRPDLAGAGVAIDHEDGQIWVAPRDGADGACLVDVAAGGVRGVAAAEVIGDVACGPPELATRWPFLTSMRTTGGGWAALVADGWDALELPDGTRIPADNHVIWLDDTAGVPETATLVGEDRSTPVALRHAVEATAETSQPDPGGSEETGTSQPITYSVFDQPVVADDPRLESVLDELAVAFPPEGDPAHTPDPETARLAHESDDLTVFAVRPRLGDGICLITVPQAGAGGGCVTPPESLSDPLPQRGFSSSPDLGVQMIEPIPDGYDTYVLDDGTEIPIPHNVLVVTGLSPAGLSGELRGPAGAARIDFGDDPALTTPSSEATSELADVCPPDLPTAPTTSASEPPTRPTADVPSPPQELRVLPPDGTGLPGQYEPSMEWTAQTQHGDAVLLGDGSSLAGSDARVVVAPFAAPLAAHCATMRLTVDQRDGQVMDLVIPSGRVRAVAVDGNSPFLVWIDPTSGVQLQLFGEGTADLGMLVAVAAETTTSNE